MLVLKSNIEITQQPTDTYPDRDLVFNFDFVTDIELKTAWENLTDTGKLVIPRKVYYKDKNGKKQTWFGKSIVSNPNETPLILRGDKIKIQLGYQYVTNGKKTTELNTEFEGYISNIVNRMPVELEVEDNMWLLKQIQAPNKTFTGTLEEMLTELLKGTPFTLKNTINGEPIKTSFGSFTTQNETIAQVLDRLQKDFRFESYFRGSELRCGSIVYYPEDRKTHTFKFQYNIISDNLTYKRTDDVRIGILVKSYKSTSTNATNKDGTKKYKTKKSQKFAYYKKGVLTLVDEKPSVFDGEIRTINVMEMPEDKLADYVKKEINRVTYNGWRGSFVTFGLPFVKQGDTVKLIDEVLPERNGTYMVKGVETRFGMDGFKREIFLDLRIDTLTNTSTGL